MALRRWYYQYFSRRRGWCNWHVDFSNSKTKDQVRRWLDILHRHPSLWRRESLKPGKSIHQIG